MSLSRTPLYDFHVKHGGRMVDFAGWEMPVQYRSILDEHKAVRRAAGLFDASHMGEVDVRGPDAFAFLQRLLTNDLSRMTPGRVVYSPMCHPDGGVVDDLLVYKRGERGGEQDYFLCVNAGNTAKDLAWLREQAGALRKTDGSRHDVSITDRSADYAVLALQGPRAAQIVQSLIAPDAPDARDAVAALKSFHFADNIAVADVRCMVSRTGYTGEDGFELYLAAADAPKLAEALLAAGAPLGLELAGLGARDSLRLEAGYSLYGHEISRDISPLTAGLDWTVKLKKEGGFIGCEALAAELAERANLQPTAAAASAAAAATTAATAATAAATAAALRKVVFFKTGDRRIVRAGSPVFNAAGEKTGEVLSGTLSPMLNEAIGSAIVGAAFANAGEPVFADIRGVKIALRIMKPPFVSFSKTKL